MPRDFPWFSMPIYDGLRGFPPRGVPDGPKAGRKFPWFPCFPWLNKICAKNPRAKKSHTHRKAKGIKSVRSFRRRSDVIREIFRFRMVTRIAKAEKSLKSVQSVGPSHTHRKRNLPKKKIVAWSWKLQLPATIYLNINYGIKKKLVNL